MVRTRCVCRITSITETNLVKFEFSHRKIRLAQNAIYHKTLLKRYILAKLNPLNGGQITEKSIIKIPASLIAAITEKIKNIFFAKFGLLLCDKTAISPTAKKQRKKRNEVLLEVLHI